MISHEPIRLFVLAFCGDCEWNARVESPTPADQARIIRQAQTHRNATDHNVAIERGQSPHSLYWRQGRKLGRTVYAQFGDEPSDDDMLLGMMDSESLAHEAVVCHNRILRWQRGDYPGSGEAGGPDRLFRSSRYTKPADLQGG